MKKILFILMLLAGPAAALSRAEVGIISFCWAMGGNPDKGHAYSLEQMIVVQKVGDGYLIEPQFIDGDVETVASMRLLYLKDWHSYQRDQVLHGYAEWTGVYTYESIDGFEQHVLAFKPCEATNQNDITEDTSTGTAEYHPLSEGRFALPNHNTNVTMIQGDIPNPTPTPPPPARKRKLSLYQMLDKAQELLGGQKAQSWLD